MNKIISENKTQQSLQNPVSVSTIKIHRGKYRTEDMEAVAHASSVSS